MKKQNSLTIVDIAQMLNVSKSTVSRAFRDSHDVHPETRGRILNLAKELDFEPNTIAKSLKEKKTKIIGVLIPSFSLPFYATAICGIQEQVSKNGYNLMICQSNETYTDEVNCLKALISCKVDGIIMSVSSETVSNNHIVQLIEKGIPVVLFNRTTSLDISTVKVDDYGGAYQMTEHLISRGYKKIFYISGPPNLLLSQHRLAGFKDAMYVNKIDVTDNMVIPSSFTIESGKDSVAGILSGGEKPDAIYCVCDIVAFGVIQYLNEHGYSIPKDIAVAGYTDEPAASLIHPSLTTIRQPIKEIGIKAAELLFRQLKYSNYTPVMITMPVQLMVREST